MIIGVTGMPCSGSDSFGKFLAEKGFTWISYSDLLREQLRNEGKELTRTSLQDLANYIRKNHGAGELSRRLIAKMKKGENYSVGTIRNPGEVEELRKRNDFVLIALHAEPRIRFERMKKRTREQDPVTFENFLKLESMESGKGQENTGLQISKCIEMADIVVENNGSFEDLRKKASELIERLNQKA